ncbi:MAG: deoxynucleoside kinase [Caldiserica bacterium]|jgi:deoxyadenosine/deoxycytidine kinase|nr:deoxynucleoside kinase [Caldisericota bacterium]MDH7562248.1 deoxynucleoside kinase [Caldisericota bacterium]
MRPKIPPVPLVGLAGNISVGKSTLAEILATRWNWMLFKEPEVLNPYLADFYREPHRWSVHSQMFFLLERYKGHLTLQEKGIPAVMDRTIYEDAEVFAYLLLDQRDWKTYRNFYNLALRRLQPPRLVVYLRASPQTLMHRLKIRGRSYEKNVSLDYLARLNRRYDQWADSFRRAPLLKVDTDGMDFVRSSSDLEKIIGLIEETLYAQESAALFP